MTSFCKRHQWASMNASSAMNNSFVQAIGCFQRASVPEGKPGGVAASSSRTADVCRPRKGSYGSTSIRVWVAYEDETTRLTGREHGSRSVQISLGYPRYGFAGAPGRRVGIAMAYRSSYQDVVRIRSRQNHCTRVPYVLVSYP
eukprot:scaffold182996_cov37-Prasinocladus_malaysianus.AAC.1